jgi:hypothetical protein
MKLEIKTNFDFGKMANKLPGIIEKTMQRYARSSATGSREAIDSGVSPALEESTLKRRKRRGTGGSKPLYETGTLYRSIKGSSEGLEMKGYGFLHHTGDLHPKTPQRKFIQISQKQIMPTLDKFKKDLKDARKK